MTEPRAPAAPDESSISIAMATYNGSAFIDRQLASLAVQTRLPDELVVRDDGSTDDTPARVRAFAIRAPFPVVVIDGGERLGYRANFTAAGRACSGSLVFFCDQDDEWMPAKLATVARAFRDPSVLLAYHNATVVGADGEARFALYDDGAERRKTAAAEPFHFSLGFTQGYRRSLHAFDDLLPLSRDHVSTRPEQLAHDQWFFMLATTLGKVAYVDAPLVRYRQHANNVYGVDATDRGLSTRLKRALVAPAWSDRARSADAEARAVVFDAIAARVAAPDKAAAERDAVRYRRLAGWLAQRDASAYGADARRRMSALLSNVAGGAYAGRDRWHFGAGWIPVDLLRAVRGTTRRVSGPA